MKKAKVSSVYEGYRRKRFRGEEDFDSRKARMHAKARIHNYRVNLRALPRALRGNRRRAIARSMAIAPKKEEIKQEAKPAVIRVFEKDQNRKNNEEENKKDEANLNIGEQTIMHMEGKVTEWPEVTASYEEEWALSGWEYWRRYDEVMSGVTWFCGVDYKDDDGLVWEDDLWNLRASNGIP